MTTPHWQEAAAMAARSHGADLRKDGRTPYFSHPARVALTIAAVFGVRDEAILTAAFLHDTIEDTGVDYDDILEAFGPEVADLVAAMTKDMRMVEPRREAAYDAQLAAASWKARLLKLADIYDNVSDALPNVSAKLIGKADRALALAENDDELRDAVRIVRELVERARVSGEEE